MGMALITFISALSIAGIAAWFSIAGLMAVFSTMPIPILLMGTVLEIGKLVTASWLYRNWADTAFLMKSMLTSMVIVLMLITSMGIFGFLSKAHIDQASPAGNNVAKIERIDKQIGREERTIGDAEAVIVQLDKSVTVLMDYDRIRGPEGALAVRKGQSQERTDLKTIIDSSQETIDKLEDEKFELNIAVRELEIEVGPIRYVAELIYEDSDSKLEEAVRWVIILIVFVFDPLAVLLLIAANQSMVQNDKKKVDMAPPRRKINNNTHGSFGSRQSSHIYDSGADDEVCIPDETGVVRAVDTEARSNDKEQKAETDDTGPEVEGLVKINDEIDNDKLRSNKAGLLSR